MRRIRGQLTYANVMVTMLAFLVLGGGTALASYVVSSNSQVGPSTISGHHPPSGDHANIIGGSLSSGDLANGAVTQSKLGNNSVTSGKVLDGTLTDRDANTSSLQARVDGSCSGGAAISQIDSGGGVSCGPAAVTQMMGGSAGTVDPNGGYLAPSGLSTQGLQASDTAGASTVPSTAGHLYVSVANPPAAGQEWHFNLNVNGTQTNLGCDITGDFGESSCTDNVDTVAIPAGATVDLYVNGFSTANNTRVRFGWTATS
jgi:hypothetical protein